MKISEIIMARRTLQNLPSSKNILLTSFLASCKVGIILSVQVGIRQSLKSGESTTESEVQSECSQIQTNNYYCQSLIFTFIKK